MVLLHGYPATCHLWRHCIPPLAERFRVYAPDLPGHGRSDKPLDVDYDLDFFVHFLCGFYDALEIGRSSLIVHDLGGMVGLGFAARYPERVTRFVVMDTTPYIEWPFMNRVVVGLARNPLCARVLTTRMGLKWALKLLGVRDRAAITDEVVELYRTPWVEDSVGRRMFRQVVSMPPERLAEPRQNLGRITAPTLILWAEKDRVLPARIARQLQGDIPDARLVIVPNCGHFLQEERPDLVVEHLLNFLSGMSGNKTG